MERNCILSFQIVFIWILNVQFRLLFPLRWKLSVSSKSDCWWVFLTISIPTISKKCISRNVFFFLLFYYCVSFGNHRWNKGWKILEIQSYNVTPSLINRWRYHVSFCDVKFDFALVQFNVKDLFASWDYNLKDIFNFYSLFIGSYRFYYVEL